MNMKHLLAAAMVSALLTQAAAAQSVTGRYKVEGRNFDGSRYSGVAEITVTSKNTCRIVWSVGSSSEGICMRNGTVFAASYGQGGTVGLVIYQIQSDGRMEGLWTMADRDGVGTETLTPLH
jgi:type 1 fimbria pilin